MIRAALRPFAQHPDIAVVQPVIHPDDRKLYEQATAGLSLLPAVNGAGSRQGSVRAGLEALHVHGPQYVLVHDAARPFVSEALISRAIAAARETGAAVPVLSATDTVKTVSPAGVVTGTLDRRLIRLVQTPQAFRFALLLAAHRRAEDAGSHDLSDDSAVAEAAGVEVMAFDGDSGNVKLTSTDDFIQAEARMLAGLSDVRTGFGVDVHPFAEGNHVMLGGVRIPHHRGLAGHSDADVVLHALVDAILGALAEGDIGGHFPPTDPRWRGASSDRFLAFAADRVRARRGHISHFDVTVVCEAPRLSQYRDLIRTRIAEIAGIGIERVAVKATTSEKLGFLGRGEGVAAFANATVRLPWNG
jgi:2-C-methyl-D-erythritol 4-phosphate cytidylyltransferase/2-C-methyl-D-erythritol 2,4-cyclodiphosphate synthase